MSAPSPMVTEATTDPHGGGLEPIRVEAYDGPGKGAFAIIRDGTVVVGSAPSCDLVVLDPAVSRRHLSLELLAGAVRARDLGSRNGVRYLNAKIQEAKVPIGGTLQVGRTRLRLSKAGTGMAEEADPPPGVVGRSPAMRHLFATLRRLARVDTPVLFEGETGTGKEALARALHQSSLRRTAPFVAFDCAAVSPTLIESELFGHAKGAFTGALSDRAGVFQAAGEGTLLLDSVDELPLELQPKLLRALEAREVQPLGGRRTVAVQCRVVASARRNLKAEADLGRFRADLYYRLAGATVVVPPLRDRPEDIPLLVACFAERGTGMDFPLAPMTLAAFQCDPWLGNVRELKNAVLRTLALGTSFEGSAAVKGPPSSYFEARERALERFERDFVSALLERCKDNVAKAAREAHLSRRQFYRLLTKHRLLPERR